MSLVGPLSGIRIIEVGVMLAGPYATMLLADLGAEVIKVEPPGGEISRQVGDSYFASLNRNKGSICLDLRSVDGQAKLAELVADSHALLVNMKPSAIKKLGLTYDSCAGTTRGSCASRSPATGCTAGTTRPSITSSKRPPGWPR